MDYKILIDDNYRTLQDKVIELLEKGYKLVGGISTTYVWQKGKEYTQAMVKED
jgi:hypothetical protein